MGGRTVSYCLSLLISLGHDTQRIGSPESNGVGKHLRQLVRFLLFVSYEYNMQ